MEAVICGLRESARIAAWKGIRLSVENHGQFGRTLEPFVRVLDAVPEVGLTLHTSRIQLMTEDYLAMVRHLAPRVTHTHPNNSVVVQDERSRWIALGEGELDFAAILSILEDEGYSGY